MVICLTLVFGALDYFSEAYGLLFSSNSELCTYTMSFLGRYLEESDAPPKLTEPVVILLTGSPGVGKTTIASSLHQYFNFKTDSYRVSPREENSLLLNHGLIEELACAVTGRPEPGSMNPPTNYVRLHKELLKSTLHTLSSETSLPPVLIFTAQVQTNPAMERKEELVEYINFARKIRRPLLWMQIVCFDPDKHWVRLLDAKSSQLAVHDGKPVFSRNLLSEVQFRKSDFENEHYIFKLPDNGSNISDLEDHTGSHLDDQPRAARRPTRVRDVNKPYDDGVHFRRFETAHLTAGQVAKEIWRSVGNRVNKTGQGMDPAWS